VYNSKKYWIVYSLEVSPAQHFCGVARQSHAPDRIHCKALREILHWIELEGTFRDCAAAGRASKKATAARWDMPNNDDLRENAGPVAAPYMAGLPSCAAIRLLRQIRPKSLCNIS
jgi:hypothetical protein